VIAEVDEALCRLIGRHLPAGTAVRLDAPKPTWQSEGRHHTVDLFLFALRDTGSAGDARRVQRCTLSYLVTAHAGKIQDEHRLLDLALGTIVGTRTLAVDGFGDEPISLRVSDIDSTALWTSLGMPARAGFVTTITAPLARPA
jgi:hypothetical protein